MKARLLSLEYDDGFFSGGGFSLSLSPNKSPYEAHSDADKMGQNPRLKGATIRFNKGAAYTDVEYAVTSPEQADTILHEMTAFGY